MARPHQSPPECRYICPCCGYRTLREPAGSYDICEVCYWDADRDEDPWQDSGPNHMSLNEGRLHFVTHGAKSPHIAEYVRAPEPKDIPVRSAPKPRLEERARDRLMESHRETRQYWVEWRRKHRHGSQMLDARRAWLASRYQYLYEPWLSIFEYHDPLEIGGGDHGLAYDTQIQWLIPFLDRVTSPVALCHAIHKELSRWFQGDVVGPDGRLENLARDAWDCLVAQRAHDGNASSQPS